MKRIVSLVLAATVALAAPAAAQPRLIGVITPRTAMPPKEEAFALVLMPPFGDRDKDVCEQFLAYYGGDASPGGYRLHWLVEQSTPITRENCATKPPERGVAAAFYDYAQTRDLVKQLRLRSDRGPYIVVVKCDPDGTSLVNAGYINLGAKSASELRASFVEFEDYLGNPNRWGKQRVIDRKGWQATKDNVGFFVRVIGRGTGLIKKMHACERT